ncbi:MAG: type VI-B CRISPR-associated RNA-guided ribonuclease Cas13b [Prevotella sp.]|nr:type VI-B CRISPR-associated RNA-guided ribonuclease Cas13b [Prevotella sp.]
MEKNKTQKGDNIYYELEDKPFWAAFLNLARHNAYIIIHHINKSLDLLKESGIEENPILSKFDFVPKEGEKTKAKRKREEEILQEKTEYWEKIERDLNRKMRYRDLILKHFPFIKAAAYRAVMNENKSRKSYEKMDNATMLEKASSYENVKSLITKFLIILKDLRNYYSHHKHSQSGTMPVFDEELINYLDDIFDASLQKVKDDYKHHETIKFSKDFNHLERKGKDGKDNTKFQYTFTESGKIKKEGLLFFISLFLEKKDAIWMQKKIKGFKGGDSDYKKMTNEVFCRSHILLPKLKLESDPSQTKNWALLDMLNELVRCPKSLYDRLHEDDRKKFQVPVDVAEEEETADNPFKNTLIRSQDRFPYFVLRFFDANELFDSLRFQIDLGNYHFSIYKKEIGGQLEDRHLTRNLYGFARIQEYDETLQPDDWKAMVKELGYEETSTTPYIAKTTPHYHLENEKIGIKFVDNNTKIWPKLETGKTTNHKDKFKNGEAFTADAFLSVHELMPMLFYYFLLRSKGNDKKSSAKVIEDYIRKKKGTLFTAYKAFASGDINNKKELEEYLKDKDILIGHLPKQMISILSDEFNNMEEAAEKKKQFMIDDTQKRLDDFNKHSNQKVKTGKRKAGVLKVGKIASWLVEDFMRFQPVDVNNQKIQPNNTKANSTEYQLLQRTLALFSSEKDRLGRYLKQTRLTGSNNPHPFLDKIYEENHSNLLSFYRSYLNERNNFLNNIQPKDWEKYQHILRLKTPKHDREKLVEGWKNGFCLPRGIFTEKIKNGLKSINLTSIYAITAEKHGGWALCPRPFLFIFKKYVKTTYNHFIAVHSMSAIRRNPKRDAMRMPTTAWSYGK